ncbi:MAG: hypothetical protein R3B45_01445 [Bdellovibrionota bacterium]
MRDYLAQAVTALEVYLDRGKVILGHLHENDLESAIQLASNRKAAFYNFRAAEAEVTKLGLDVAKDAKFQDLWQQIRSLNTEIDTSLVQLQDELEEKMIRFKKNRMDFERYKSGIQKPRTVTTPV